MTTFPPIEASASNFETPDTQPPAFAELDRIEKELALLDEWAMTWIGRMQPYSTSAVLIKAAIGDSVFRDQGQPGLAVAGNVTSTMEMGRSPFEMRVKALATRVAEITQALTDMSERCRL